MKILISGIILAIAAIFIINFVDTGAQAKTTNNPKIETTAKAGDIPEQTILVKEAPPKATTTPETKPVAAKITKPAPAKTTTPAPAKSEKPATVKAASTNQTVNGVKWDASALKMISGMQQFDYSKTIRQAYINKVNAYAKRNGIKTVTASVIKNMRE
jgi:hypothetical protein